VLRIHRFNFFARLNPCWLVFLTVLWLSGCTGIFPGASLTKPDLPTPGKSSQSIPSTTPSPQAPSATASSATASYAVMTQPAPSLTPTLILPSSTPRPLTETPTGASPMPSPTPTACSLKSGQVSQNRLDSALLKATLIFRVYLPPCYGSQPDQRYPVLYLLHGLTFTDDQWVRLGAATTADRLISTGQIDPLIIVMPQDDDWRQPAKSKFGQAVVDELMPWIDRHYQARTDQGGRAIGGLSRGASWAVHIGLANWRMFTAIGAHSLALFWTENNEFDQLLAEAAWDNFPMMYLDIGSKDPDLASTLEFEGKLKANHVPYEWHLFPGFHDEPYWQAHLEGYLHWYSAQFTVDN
jgi:enterochelin esterase-like enzyme